MKYAKMVQTLLVFFVGLFLSFPNCQKDSAEKSDASIIAKIDDFEITYKQFSDHFKKLYPRQNLRKASAQDKKQVLDDMINQLLTLQEAYRLGYDKKPEVVDVIAKKEKILAAEAYEKKEVYDKVLTTQLIRQYYTWSKRKLKLSRMKFVYGTDSSLVEEKEQKAYEVYRKLQEGADFKRLAVLYSEHQNAQNDSGSLGAIDCFQMDEDIFGRAYDLPVGEAGEPFHANNAYYILLVEKRIPQKVRAFEKERAQIVENLKKKYAFKLSHEFFQLRKKLRTEYHYRLLSENIDFFCNRAKAIITKEDSTDLFNDTERSVALCESDINKITIGEFFRKAFPFFWNSLDEKRLVEKLLSKDCLEQLTQYKA
ncbi:hypothetical protein GF337_16065, partial [candidate division KSB1 bacterium]|nr:hypothetical protein [candidate division KSB1 bacterium]